MKYITQILLLFALGAFIVGCDEPNNVEPEQNTYELLDFSSGSVDLSFPESQEVFIVKNDREFLNTISSKVYQWERDTYKIWFQIETGIPHDWDYLNKHYISVADGNPIPAPEEVCCDLQGWTPIAGGGGRILHIQCCYDDGSECTMHYEIVPE